MKATVTLVSEDAILLSLGDRIDEQLTPRIALLCEQIEASLGPRLLDMVPSYTTILCTYDPLTTDTGRLKRDLERLVAHWATETSTPTWQASIASSGSVRLHQIPVFYSPEVAPDLEAHARACSLSVAELIEIHAAGSYQVFAVGFSPGFGFLGQVDPRIARPRKATPRTRVPRGAVGIADRQTAVYPVASPGGWQLIGRSPSVLFDERTLAVLKVGDRVRFSPLSRDEYLALGGEL